MGVEDFKLPQRRTDSCNHAKEIPNFRTYHMIQIGYLSPPIDPLLRVLQRGEKLLNASERLRYDRYARSESKQELILSRWLAHEQLARCFPKSSAHWELSHDPVGRPIAIHTDTNQAVHLSISHCKRLTVCALCEGTFLGIDAESTTQTLRDSFRDIAYTNLERDLIRNSHFSQQNELLWRWTIKESIAKMTGNVGFEAIANVCTASLPYLPPSQWVRFDEEGAWIYPLRTSHHHFVSLAIPISLDPPIEPLCTNASTWMDF